MESQHRIARSGVVMLRQSSPYAASATATTATKIVLAVPINVEASPPGFKSQAAAHESRNRWRNIPMALKTQSGRLFRRVVQDCGADGDSSRVR